MSCEPKVRIISVEIALIMAFIHSYKALLMPTINRSVAVTSQHEDCDNIWGHHIKPVYKIVDHLNVSLSAGSNFSYMIIIKVNVH